MALLGRPVSADCSVFQLLLSTSSYTKFPFVAGESEYDVPKELDFERWHNRVMAARPTR
jgi:hypothetical protein